MFAGRSKPSRVPLGNAANALSVGAAIDRSEGKVLI